MKRIVAFALAVIMTMTMFCALSLTSSAEDEYDVELSLDVSEPDADGVYTIYWYSKDNSEYGLIAQNVELMVNFDEVEVVPYVLDEAYDARGRVMNAADCIYEMDVTYMSNILKKMAADFDNGGLMLEVRNAINSTTYYNKNRTVKATGIKAGAYKFDTTNPSLYRYTSYYYVDGPVDTYTYVLDEGEDRLLLGTLKVKLKDGVTSSTITTGKTEGKNGNVIKASDYSDEPAIIQATVKTDSVTLKGEVKEDPVKLEVMPGASIRYSNPQGLRFMSKITVVDSAVELDKIEVGTYITAENSDAVLDVPCGIYANEDEGLYSAVVSNLKASNYTRTFYAQAYAIVNGVTYTSAVNAGATAQAVASAVLADDSIEFVTDRADYVKIAMELLHTYAGE